MLWAWKYSNEDALQSYQNNGSENDLHIIDGNDGVNYVGGFLKNSKTITGGAVRYKFIFELFSRSNANGGFTNEGDTNVYEPKYKKYSSTPSFIELGDDADQFLANQASSQGFKSFELETTGLKIWKRESDTQTETLSVRYEIAGFESQTVDSPISDAPPKSACFLITEPKQLYLRFGYLLHFIYKKLIPKIKTKDADYDDYPSIFKMRYDIHDGHKQGFTQVMYSLPNQISLDPRVCIVRNNRIEKEAGINKAYTNLLPFRTSDYVDSGNPNKAYSSNIYLNFEFIIECLNSNTDERGDVSVYNFLKAICDGLNKALGGVNNLEPVMDEETNTLSIIDTTPIPGLTGTGQNYTLQLYGYDKIGNGSHISNFVRNVDLKTAITPEFATMVTVGATAGGYVKGTEATAFSRWNVGLIDRFKEEFTPGNINSSPSPGSDEAVVNYNKKMLAVPKITQFYGFSGNIQGGNSKNLKISTDAIETNLSVGTEYYKYIIASNQTQNGGTVGFIPFKISFTMDGLSGIKIYNKLHVDTRFLPKAYGDSLDLIVTGVSHKLQKNDWETDIEATVIPKTSGTTTYTPQTQQQQQSGSAPGGTTPTFTDCAKIPSISVNSGFGAVKASTTDFTELIKIVIESQEGTYYHPLQSIDSKTNEIIANGEMAASGETLWGIDRAAGQQETTEEGRYFWKEVDKISGFGYYGTNGVSKSYVTSAWAEWRIKNGKTSPFTIKSNPWKRNDGRATPTNLPELFKYAVPKFIEPKIRSAINLYFNKNKSSNAQTVKNLVFSDGRLLYMYIRSWYSGPGSRMEGDVNSIIKIYDSGVRDVETLACKELGARWDRRGDNAIAHKSHSQIKALIGLK
jgi:hypothetical protein